MPRLRHCHTGVILNVSDETAAMLSRDWEPVDEPPVKPAKQAKPRRRKVED